MVYLSSFIFSCTFPRSLLSPHIPHGLHMEWTSFHMDSTWIPPFHMEYILAEIPLILGPLFHMDSTWIPYGMVMEYPNSTWNGGMSTWSPHGMRMEFIH